LQNINFFLHNPGILVKFFGQILGLLQQFHAEYALLVKKILCFAKKAWYFFRLERLDTIDYREKAIADNSLMFAEINHKIILH